MNQSWTLCWTFIAKFYKKAPQHSPCLPCPCSSWTTTSNARTSRPPSSAGISPLPRKVIRVDVGEITTWEYAVLLTTTREACASSWHRPMMTAPLTQHLHPTRHPQPRSPHLRCCLLIAPTQPWLPPMVPPKEHISQTCHPHLPQQGVSPSSCPPCCTPLTIDAPLTPSQMK